MTYTTISYGGGVQSTAMIVLAATGRIHADVALFCNVGDDSEHPATLAYVRDIAIPWATEHGLEIIELHRHRRDGTPETLRGRLMREGSRSLPIPIRMSNGAPGNRSCTQDFKIKLLGKWIKTNVERNHWPIDVLIGISVDEIQRAGRGRDELHEVRRYPLLDLGMSRTDCANVIRDAGLPVPPKSACYFCPFHRPQTWAEMRRDEPELFADAQLIEDTLNARRDVLGKDHVWLTRFDRRLSDAIGEAQTPLFDGDGIDIGIGDDDGCDEGVCFV